MATSKTLVYKLQSTLHRSSAPLRRICVLFVMVMLVGAVNAQTASPLTETLKIGKQGIVVSYPQSWSVSPQRFLNAYKLVNVPANQRDITRPTARIKITTETRTNHADALRRLKELGAGLGLSPPPFRQINGWPALQFSRAETRPQPSSGAAFADNKVLRVTTVVAAGRLLVRLDGSLPSNASPQLIEQAEAIGRSLVSETASDSVKVQQELKKLRDLPAESSITIPTQRAKTKPSAAPDFEALDVTGEVASGENQRVFAGGFGEIEIAASTDGQHIVIGRQSDWVTSNDGGQTFPPLFSGTIAAFNGGDPSVAYAVSGAFYYAGIDRGCENSTSPNPPVPDPVSAPFGFDCTGMAQSTNNGQSFPLVNPAVVCIARAPAGSGMPDPANACFPDQEHIAADRFNAGVGGGDQIYSTWRNFDSTDQDAGIVCSQDSGQTWSAPLDLGTGFFPRITVGQDGFVYVAYFDGISGYQIDKYSACRDGLVRQPGFPQTVAARIPVVCPFAGHDRCDQNPSSQTVAVDDTNPNHVYYAFAQNTAVGNEDIIVRDSLDGGASWPAGRAVQVNAAVPSQRIMPWMCTTGGEALVAWFDRRFATVANNDLTDYFAGRVGLNTLGDLSAGNEFRVSEVADPWCGPPSTPWPAPTRQALNPPPGASEACSVQPQLGGQCCQDGPAADGFCDPGTATGISCDVSDDNPGTRCNAGEVCLGGNGVPRYGDYNGNACSAGRLFAGWASATSPPGVPSPLPGAVGILFDSFSVACDCNAPGVITGSAGDDKLLGTPGDDIICALEGDDSIVALGGNDCVDGGPGDDNITAGSGDDKVAGDFGNDVITGGNGEDQLLGGGGDDDIAGGLDDDVIDGGFGLDRITGGPGADVCTNGDIVACEPP